MAISESDSRAKDSEPWNPIDWHIWAMAILEIEEWRGGDIIRLGRKNLSSAEP